MVPKTPANCNRIVYLNRPVRWKWHRQSMERSVENGRVSATPRLHAGGLRALINRLSYANIVATAALFVALGGRLDDAVLRQELKRPAAGGFSARRVCAAVPRPFGVGDRDCRLLLRAPAGTRAGQVAFRTLITERRPARSCGRSGRGQRSRRSPRPSVCASALTRCRQPWRYSQSGTGPRGPGRPPPSVRGEARSKHHPRARRKPAGIRRTDASG
jgi:hypothetical protein